MNSSSPNAVEYAYLRGQREHDGFAQTLPLSQDFQQQAQTLHFDPVTGLYNRLYFYTRGQRLLIDSQEKNQFGGLILLDLDRFQRINQAYGEIIGDQVLRKFSQRLAVFAASYQAMALRLGGNEFAVLLTAKETPPLLEPITQELIQTITHTPFTVAQQPLHLGFCAGLANFPTAGASLEALFNAAGSALLKAKELGGNTYNLYSQPTNQEDAKQNLILENDLHCALKSKEFVLHYQPFSDTRTGKIIGLEALIRWNHPRHGLLTPDRFIPACEASGLIVAIGTWVLEESCRFIKHLQAQGHPDIRLAVNISPRQLTDKYFFDRLETLLHHLDVSSNNLELEITENLIMHNPDESLALMIKIRQMGICLALDDFGTGYSSLSQLQKFPFTTLKIDKSFIQKTCLEENSMAIINAIITMGKSLGLKITAEGVEKESQRLLLQEKECDTIQGFLISKPLSALDIMTFLDCHPIKS